ncbi:MAG: hypothetical protein UW34_C0016G0002 [Parcubacteria group bacterium GW2011_GWA2_44_15]|nr:MAG: hypothetical protein UW34_C0016G0002 [Parcubacteria group bacterium GW2011_GWA2_44_15]
MVVMRGLYSPRFCCIFKVAGLLTPIYMTTKTKLVILTAILVGAPMVAYIIAPFHFVYSDFTLNIFPFIPLAMVFFGALFALYFMRLKTGKLTTIRLFIKWGIYLYIAYFIILIATDLYLVLPLLSFDLRIAEMGGVGYASGYQLKEYPQHLLAENYLSLILIVLMYLGLRLNKSIESGSGGIQRYG